MADKRKYGEDHISKTLRQIDPSTWLLGNLVLRRSPEPTEKATWVDHGDNSSYTITDGADVKSFAGRTTVPDSPYINLFHEVADQSAVWAIGNDAVCKVRYIDEGITPESVTLNFVRDQQPNFEIPKVLHHGYGEDRSYLFLQRVPGRTLDNAWMSLDQHWRRQYVDAIVQVIKEMATWKNQTFGGVDGQDVPEYYLANGQAPNDLRSATLRAACEELGMDCSSFAF